MKLRIIDITNQLPKGPGTYAKRHLGQIVRFVIHHSADPKGTPQKYANYHVYSHGWPGIGYHFVIQKDGTIYQTNALETISYGVANYNTGSVNICLTGNYTIEMPPPKQMESLIWLLKDLSGRLGPKPIEAHSTYTATKCPGDNINTEQISQAVYGPLA